jgi:hypothetical protein
MEYISKLFDKILQILSTLARLILEKGLKNKQIIAFIIGIILYFDFFNRVGMLIIYNLDGIVHNLEKRSPITKGILIVPLIFILIVLIEVLISFVTPNKKKIDTSNIINDKKFVPFLERFYCVLPYIWFLIEINMTLFSDCLNLVRAYLPPSTSREIITFFLFPLNYIYFAMPGLKFGILTNYLFYISYNLISRAKNKFSYFLRYNFMQLIMLGAIFGFYTNCYFMVIKYCSFETSGMVGISVLGVFNSIIIYLIIFILLGKESKFPFIDEALQFHIGRRKKK